ncbi:guanine nucleotide exchange factor VPS9 [Sugiyamaella lignohabitans]|uniref:Guanine nucleotide exchange factor VPS9 n=1 Tax=Sugiyamaella lignohabitans TaxID=796027 RepID=A0A167D7Q7_9ASCO|nr:guanine nucleotide exchange factor VPS9 [Sugiyamaella lignohabitans]ANB12583.1 guanine nucleotide exchange factor VPS9 [Sugiyamaella lignohabitans]
MSGEPSDKTSSSTGGWDAPEPENSERIGPNDTSTSVSPVIRTTYIHPGEPRSALSPTYDTAPGSISFSHSSTPSQDLQDILEHFDPLTTISSNKTHITEERESGGNIEAQEGSGQRAVTPGTELDSAQDDRCYSPEQAPQSEKKLEEKHASHNYLEQNAASSEESDSLIPEDEQITNKSSVGSSSLHNSSQSKQNPKSVIQPGTQYENSRQPSISISEKNGSNTPALDHSIKDEDVKPFDFQRFLDQLRHKSADPIARYVKSFLSEFNKRTWTTSEQEKIISDFKAFIAAKMDLCPPFSTLSNSEMTNAIEGMEKLIMNRLYTKTFSPEIPVNQRDDIHEEDVLRDRVLQEKMRIWHWIEGRHLDLADRFLRNGEAFVKLASDELTKINHYRAPRDKVICILNCCKVIFGLLRQTNSEQSADGFLPILIYVVIKAQPKDLISNLNYIQRFRNQDMLNGEAGYYISSLSGAISFIESLDRSGLSITDEEFEMNVEQSVKSIAEPAASVSTNSPPRTPSRQPSPSHVAAKISKSTETNVEVPGEGLSQSPNRPATPSNLNASTVLYQSAGLLVAPFKSLSKMFDDGEVGSTSESESNSKGSRELSSSPSPEESAARQVSAEEDEAQRIHQVEFENVSKTLSQMFPTLDQEVIQDVLRETEGRVGAAVDICLALLES